MNNPSACPRFSPSLVPIATINPLLCASCLLMLPALGAATEWTISTRFGRALGAVSTPLLVKVVLGLNRFGSLAKTQSLSRRNTLPLGAHFAPRISQFKEKYDECKHIIRLASL